MNIDAFKELMKAKFSTTDLEFLEAKPNNKLGLFIIINGELTDLFIPYVRIEAIEFSHSHVRGLSVEGVAYDIAEKIQFVRIFPEYPSRIEYITLTGLVMSPRRKDSVKQDIPYPSWSEEETKAFVNDLRTLIIKYKTKADARQTIEFEERDRREWERLSKKFMPTSIDRVIPNVSKEERSKLQEGVDETPCFKRQPPPIVEIPEPPKPPLGRIDREGTTHFCPICGSTASKKGWLGLFGERTCDNKECPNSNKSGKDDIKWR